MFLDWLSKKFTVEIRIDGELDSIMTGTGISIRDSLARAFGATNAVRLLLYGNTKYLGMRPADGEEREITLKFIDEPIYSQEADG